MTAAPHRPRLVAHRGHARVAPENTMIALESALDAGARIVEIDVQLSNDGVPFVLHDPDLRRTAGIDRVALDLDAAALDRVSVHEPARFGARFEPTPIPRLPVVAERLAAARTLTFVEIKPQSLDRHDPAAAVDAITAAMMPLAEHGVVISFRRDALARVRATTSFAVGWILPDYDAGVRETAADLAPDYLFVDVERVPPGSHLWPGPWDWAVYEVVDPDAALAWAARGATLVETMAYADLAADPRLAPEARA